MNESSYRVIFEEPVWYRWLDGLAVLVIGFTLGIVITQGRMLFETQVTDVTSPTYVLPNSGTGKLEMPAQPIQFQEI